MQHSLLTENYHLAIGKSPVADFAATSAISDVVNMKNFHSFGAIVFWGVGTTGTFTATVEACDDVVPTNVTAIPFKYRVITGGLNAGDTHGTLTQATAAGFTSTAGSHQIVVIEVASEELGDTGKSYARVKLTEVVASALLGGILLFQGRPRYDTTTSTIT